MRESAGLSGAERLKNEREERIVEASQGRVRDADNAAELERSATADYIEWRLAQPQQ